jgi:D-alanyl-D-alanine carboxypeptidase
VAIAAALLLTASCSRPEPARTESAAASGTDTATQELQVDSLVQRWMAEHHLPGLAVAVRRDGRVIHARGYGTRDLAAREPVTPDTPFQIASITKALTATAVMQLVESGRIALDDSVGRHLADLPEAWRAVTLRQLLTHTSGIPSISGFDQPPCNAGKLPAAYARGDVLREVSCLPLAFTPGDRWEYGDTGYYLLGLLLTVLSGASYEAHMTERVFQPAGMAQTRVQRRPPLSDIAEPVRWESGAYVAVAPFDPMVDEANGAIVSTVLDLARWDAALDANTLVSAKTRDAMWTPAALREGVASYGLGFGLTPFTGHRRVGHNGGGPGSSTAFAKFPDNRLTVIVLARGELPGGAAQRFANEIAAVYLPPASH